jgi:uncharacterized membrane protein
MNRFLLASLFIIFLDLFYYFLTKDIYIGKIQEIQKSTFQFRIEGALIRYVALCAGFYYFIALRGGKPIDAALYGAVFGSIFNGTMYASFTEWNAVGAFLDTLWLSVLLTSATYILY